MIDYRGDEINQIKTNIDLEKDLVTYKLDKYWDRKET